MVHIVPSISFVKQFRGFVEGGFSIKQSLQKACHRESGEFSLKVSLWLSSFERGCPVDELFTSHFQQSFMEVVELGLRGAPVLQQVERIEREMEQEFEIQWKAYLETLPMKLAIPLLIFFFPAYLILLFGPLLTQFLQEVM